MNRRKKQTNQSEKKQKITLEDWLLSVLIVGVFFMIAVLVYHNLTHG